MPPVFVLVQNSRSVLSDETGKKINNPSSASVGSAPGQPFLTVL